MKKVFKTSRYTFEIMFVEGTSFLCYNLINENMSETKKFSYFAVIRFLFVLKFAHCFCWFKDELS